IGAIKFKTKVNKVDLPNVEIEDQEFIIDGMNYEHHNRYMELELLRTYNDDLFTYDVLKNNGLKSVQGPTKMTDELFSFISQTTNPIREQEYFFVDRKSTRLNSSHVSISYAAFCVKHKQ